MIIHGNSNSNNLIVQVILLIRNHGNNKCQLYDSSATSSRHLFITTIFVTISTKSIQYQYSQQHPLSHRHLPSQYYSSQSSAQFFKEGMIIHENSNSSNLIVQIILLIRQQVQLHDLTYTTSGPSIHPSSSATKSISIFVTISSIISSQYYSTPHPPSKHSSPSS